MDETRTFRQVAPEERVTIAALRLQGAAVREVARKFGRCPATISRELARNTGGLSQYSSERATTLHAMRRRAARRPRRLVPDSVMWQTVKPLLA